VVLVVSEELAEQAGQVALEDLVVQEVLVAEAVAAVVRL
jgi:hypothetical protein